MPVVSVKERHQDRRSSYRDGKRTHQRSWLVVCDSASDGTAAALAAVPSPGTGHPQDYSAKLGGIDASPHGDSDRHFLVTGEYMGTGDIGLPLNPIDRPPEVSFSFTEGTEAYFSDYSTPDPKRTTNSSGDPFETYLERETGELVINITTNEATFNVVDLDELKHSTNSGAVVIDGVTFAEGTLKLSPPSAQRIMENIEGEGGTIQRFVYYRVSWQLKARKAGWRDVVLDVGTNELIPNADITKPPKLRPITDGASLPVKRPWPLNGQGRKKPSPKDKPEELEFTPYKPASWTWRWTTAQAWAA